MARDVHGALGVEASINTMLSRSVRVSLLLVFLAGCEVVRWPVTNYPMLCTADSWLAPFQPSCLNEFNTEEGFKYRDEFHACRVSVQNFLAALEQWRQCRLNQLKQVSKDLAKQVEATLQCRRKKDKNYGGVCPLVSASFSDKHFYSLGIYGGNPPRCVTSDRVPQASDFLRDLKVDRCERESRQFLNGLPATVRRHAENIDSESRTKADEATRTFNCMAQRERFCM